MKAIWRYLAIGVFVVLLVLVIVLFNASSWLESGSGRDLLQRELSKILKLEADFRGEYSLQLFPVIRIAGRDLALNDSATGLAIASFDSYELHLALRPLLRREVSIPKVEIHSGTLDLDRLAEHNAAGTDVESDFQLPGIRDLEITGLQLQKSAVDFLFIAELNLADFAENQKSRISLELASDRATAASENAYLEGFLQVTVSPLTLNLLVDELLLQFAEQNWNVGRGELSWSADQQSLWGEMNGSVATYSSHYAFSILSGDALQISLTVGLQSADKKSLAMNLEAQQDAPDRWQLKTVVLDLDGQNLGGTGCFAANGEPTLQFRLEAQQLDLDAVQELLPAGLFAGDPDPTGEASAVQISEEVELPVRLAIVLTADELRWSGATAQSVRLLIGAEPDCTVTEDALSN